MYKRTYSWFEMDIELDEIVLGEEKETGIIRRRKIADDPPRFTRRPQTHCSALRAAPSHFI
jgi:hypothetical protein